MGSGGNTTISEQAVARPQFAHEAVIVFFVLSGYFVGGSAWALNQEPIMVLEAIHPAIG